MLKQLFNIRGKNSILSQPVLSFIIGEKYCCYAIIDGQNGELDQLAYYAAPAIRLKELEVIITNYSQLSNEFKEVIIGYDYTDNIFVPAELYQPGDTDLLLRLMGGNIAERMVEAEIVPGHNIYNVYAVPKDVHAMLNRKFPSARHWHIYTVGINSIKDDAEAGLILLDCRAEDFTIIVSKNNELLLAQNFAWSTHEDVIYYLLNVCQQFGFSQRDVTVFLSGLIDRNSTLYFQLYQYFLHTQFREVDWTHNDQYPAHFFTSLNDLVKCAS